MNYSTPYSLHSHPMQSMYFDSMREVLAPQYRRLGDQQLAGILRDALEGMSEMEREAFSALSLQHTYNEHADDFGNFVKSVGGLAKKALPIVAPIAKVAAPLVGTMIGGPVGGMIGSKVGNMIGNLGGKASSPKNAMSAGLASIGAQTQPSVGNVNPNAAAPQLSPNINPATAQLIVFLNSPQLIQSILGQVLGNVGNGSATVEQPNAVEVIPFGAMMNTLSELAQRAAFESVRSGSMESESYLMDSHGGYRVEDPSNPEERADAVMELLAEDYNMRNNTTGIEEPVGESLSFQRESLTEWLVKAGMVH